MLNVRFAETNSWYIRQMVDLLQLYGDCAPSSCTRQLIDVIKHGQLIAVFVLTCMEDDRIHLAIIIVKNQNADCQFLLKF